MHDYETTLEHLRGELETVYPESTVARKSESCKRIPVPLYQSNSSNNLLPLKIKSFSPFFFSCIWNSTAFFHSILQAQKGEGKDMIKIWAGVKCCIKGVHRNKSDTEINFTFLLSPNKVLPALKSDYPIDQWLITWMLLVSPFLQSPSLILGPQNSYLTLEMHCKLRRSLEMSGLLTMTFVLNKWRLRVVPNLVVPEETKH